MVKVKTSEIHGKDDFTVVALKDIEKGEELLHDYGWDKC